MKKAFVIFEYPPEADYQLQSALAKFREKAPGFEIRPVCGFLRRYVPGGLHPARILNLVWMYILVPFHILLFRPSWILVRSAPPGIQVWASLWAVPFRIPTLAWIMDYHPEIEARTLGKYPWLHPLAGFLRMVDSLSLEQLAGVVTLDVAMKQALVSKVPGLPVLVHPTWDEYSLEQEANPSLASLPDSLAPHPLRLAYAGNLSMNHPLEPIGHVIRHYQGLYPGIPIRLLVVGTSSAGEARFRKFAVDHGVEVEILPRLPFPVLRETLAKEGIHYGILLMEDRVAGLFSPSKFAGYLAAGIPLLYFGPPNTNADMICKEFGAGISIPSSPLPAQIEDTGRSLGDPDQLASHKKAVPDASRYFANHNADTFVDAALSLLLPIEKPPSTP